MDKQEFLRRLMTTFLAELEEKIRDFNTALLQLEKAEGAGEQQPHLRQLLGIAHSLKGAARAVNVKQLEYALHQFEAILLPFHESHKPLPPELMPVLFRVVDCVEEAGLRLREEQSLAGSPLEQVLPLLKGVIDTGSIPEGIDLHPFILATSPEAKLELPALPFSEPVLAPPAPGNTAPASPATPRSTVRVQADKLDSLLNQAGELLVARQRLESRTGDLEQALRFVTEWRNEWRSLLKLFRRLGSRPELLESRARAQQPFTLDLSVAEARTAAEAEERFNGLQQLLDQLATNLNRDSRMLSQVSSGLESEVQRVRLFPFVESCAGLERAVRDLARSTGKEVRLDIRGEHVQVDRSVLEGLKDPLLHLVRNAVDHGIEPPEQRQALGKNRQATLLVSAELRGSRVEVRVADDGRGFDLDAIREQAHRKKLPAPLDDQEATRLVFLAGFSTSAIVTDVSGRGIGLDVVKSRIEALHGTVEVDSTPGRGTEFCISVPLTLSTIRCVLVRVAEQLYAFDTDGVERFLSLTSEQVHLLGGRPMLLRRETPLPLVDLAGLLGLPASKPQASLVMIHKTGGQSVGFLIDEILSEQDILVKNLGRRVGRLPHVAGGTLLPSGQIALVLNGAELARRAWLSGPRPLTEPEAEAEKGDEKKRLLTVDDSITTRLLLRSILETAGYDVTLAEDGEKAWELLQGQSFDLVVTDVDMPGLNGFELTQRIRQAARLELQELPVVLVTARDSRADKQRGLDVKANAYVVKGAFEQDNLLQAIQQLL